MASTPSQTAPSAKATASGSAAARPLPGHRRPDHHRSARQEIRSARALDDVTPKPTPEEIEARRAERLYRQPRGRRARRIADGSSKSADSNAAIEVLKSRIQIKIPFYQLQLPATG